MHDDEAGGRGPGRDVSSEDASLTEGQKRRLDLFRRVESGVCSRIESLCERSGLDVTDVAVLVVGPSAPEVFFGPGKERVVNVVMGHRTRVHALLTGLLPPLPGSGVDPYGDLLVSAPDRCVRVLIIDEESLTVLSYGSFVTVRIDPRKKAVA